MFIVQMLANVGEKAEKFKYITFFTLFDPNGILSGEKSALLGAWALLLGAVILFAAGIEVFCRKDLHI